MNIIHLDMTVQEILGLTSQSEWTGVMLSTLFRELGVDPKATWFWLKAEMRPYLPAVSRQLKPGTTL